MWTTNNQSEMQDLLKIFGQDNREIYGDHAYSAGFLESMIVQMLPYLPKRVQKDFIADMQRETVRSRTRLLEVRSQNRTFERI